MTLNNVQMAYENRIAQVLNLLYDKNPTVLIFGAKKNIFNASVSIKIDSKGNFVGVVQGDNTYPVNDWNERFKNTDPNPKPN